MESLQSKFCAEPDVVFLWPSMTDNVSSAVTQTRLTSPPLRLNASKCQPAESEAKPC